MSKVSVCAYCGKPIDEVMFSIGVIPYCGNTCFEEGVSKIPPFRVSKIPPFKEPELEHQRKMALLDLKYSGQPEPTLPKPIKEPKPYPKRDKQYPYPPLDQ